MLAERGVDAALRRDGVRTRREQLGDAGRVQARLRQTERRAQTRTTGTDDDRIVCAA